MEGEEPIQELADRASVIETLAQSDNIGQVKQIHDQAEAVRTFARTASRGLKLQDQAAEVKLRAERLDFLRLGVRGRLPFLVNSVTSLARSKSRAEASDAVRDLLERVSPGPYLQIIGAAEKRGWTVVAGNGAS